MQQLFGTTNPLPNYPVRYNIAPTQEVLAVRLNPENGQRSLDLLRWGLIPNWAKDDSMAAKLINARAETLSEKPSFRGALAKRRCIIPADAFYEWRALEKGKQPYAIRRKDLGLLNFAGLWENWRQPDGHWRRSCSIITTTANAELSFLHHRMPVILDQAEIGHWLGDGDVSLLRPCPPEWLEFYPVGAEVGKVGLDQRSLLAPISLAQAAPQP